MKLSRWLLVPALLGAALVRVSAADAPAERALKLDRSKSYVDVDVKATIDSFTGHLDRYELAVPLDANGKIKDALLKFKFTDLRTGKPDRDAEMIKWLGGGEPEGSFDLGLLALAPDGQGQASGKLTFHGQTQLVEFPVLVKAQDGVYTVTGKTTIDYRNWGLKKFRKFGLATVDPEVTIRFQFVGALPAAAAE
ncbi:YceI family protein [Oleiharenicola sp. Vm1]|uniref:YceI family protein n=1 Tax=Oleiharenicola sp. Vm1 TaxID=3398393 RepID=UPI0039F46197